jgi:hypothetical protein
MPVYRCASCGFVAEDQSASAGTKIPCEKCATPTVFFAAPFYIQRLVERYLAARRELEALRQLDEGPEQEVPEPAAAVPAPSEQPHLKTDLYNTNGFATAAQHKPLQNWFSAKQIKAAFDFTLVDTSGFFDEVAQEIGDNYELLSGPIEQVRYAYRKSFSWVNLSLANRSADEGQFINTLFRRLYGYSLFSRYAYQKQKKMLGLAVQPALAVRAFFEGGWLEWYAFMSILTVCTERARRFSCARSVKIEFQNEESRELDVAFLIDGQAPIFVECKSGEFRGDIEKYLKLRRRLGVDRSRFIVCSSDLTVEQATGLTAMYELTFVNLELLKAHVRSLV